MTTRLRDDTVCHDDRSRRHYLELVDLAERCGESGGTASASGPRRQHIETSGVTRTLADRIRACPSTFDGPGLHPGHPTAKRGLPASEPDLSLALLTFSRRLR